jgi:hypothetical protein
VIDRLRAWLNRPFRDRDRWPLFMIAVAVVLAAATALALLDGSDRTPVRAAPTKTDAHARRAPRQPAPVSPTALEAPSEEGRLDSAAAARRSEIAAARRAAHRFLRDYLPYTYGRRSANQIALASSDLRQRLTMHRPRVSARERNRRAHVVLVQPNGVGRVRAGMIALIDDGARRYTVALELTRRRSGWLVTDVGG